MKEAGYNFQHRLRTVKIESIQELRFVFCLLNNLETKLWLLPICHGVLVIVSKYSD